MPQLHDGARRAQGALERRRRAQGHLERGAEPTAEVRDGAYREEMPPERAGTGQGDEGIAGVVVGVIVDDDAIAALEVEPAQAMMTGTMGL
jgi:hypothetical protein